MDGTAGVAGCLQWHISLVPDPGLAPGLADRTFLRTSNDVTLGHPENLPGTVLMRVATTVRRLSWLSRHLPSLHAGQSFPKAPNRCLM
ncbi:hypothetical protein AD930_12750 [Acetobacter malorum]|nr:hypothetical protein AD930_12750 [Acetobacter malorum]